MKFGMNLLLWSGDLTDELVPVLEKLKSMGYDGVELPIFDADPAKFAKWGKRLDEIGLERTAVTVVYPIAPNTTTKTSNIHSSNLRRMDIAMSGSLDAQHVADAAQGVDEARLGVVELAPQERDVVLDHARVAAVLVA